MKAQSIVQVSFWLALINEPISLNLCAAPRQEEFALWLSHIFSPSSFIFQQSVPFLSLCVAQKFQPKENPCNNIKIFSFLLFERILLALKFMIVWPHSTSSPRLGIRVDFQGLFSSFLSSLEDIFHANRIPVPLLPAKRTYRRPACCKGQKKMPSVKMAAAALLCPFLTSAKTTSF